MLSWLRRLEHADRIETTPQPSRRDLIRVLVVDDDAALRELLRTSLEMADIVVDEAQEATAASRQIALRHPDVIVLDVGMPGVDGITFCRALKSDPRTRDIPVVLLTGNADVELAGWRAGAGAFLRKPFSPLTLLTVVERLAARSGLGAQPPAASPPSGGQLLELERAQRKLLQEAYRETVVALAHALESKDGATGAHSERVRRYATELARAVDPYLLEEPSLEYGFILHDVGKIAIPDAVLGKREPLTESEWRLLRTHPKLGEQMVGNATLLRGHGVDVVRSHHERWDGLGYPERRAGDEIPLAARIFTVADALDAIKSDRPYRAARGWSDAVKEIVVQGGTQFDPDVVGVFLEREEGFRRIYEEFNLDGRASFSASWSQASDEEDWY